MGDDVFNWSKALKEDRGEGDGVMFYYTPDELLDLPKLKERVKDVMKKVIRLALGRYKNGKTEVN